MGGGRRIRWWGLSHGWSDPLWTSSATVWLTWWRSGLSGHCMPPWWGHRRSQERRKVFSPGVWPRRPPWQRPWKWPSCKVRCAPAARRTSWDWPRPWPGRSPSQVLLHRCSYGGELPAAFWGVLVLPSSGLQTATSWHLYISNVQQPLYERFLIASTHLLNEVSRLELSDALPWNGWVHSCLK